MTAPATVTRDFPGTGSLSVRKATLDASAIDKEARTVPVSMSSDKPVPRADGSPEILLHEPKAVRLERAGNGLPLLLDHDPHKALGVVENIRIEGGRLVGVARFGRSQTASEVWEDVVSGNRRFISVGYQIHNARQQDDGTVLVTDWEPYECSVVGIAADPSVGFNRSGRIHNMTTTPTAKAETNQPENQQATAATERKRCTEITAIGRKFGLEDKAQLAIDDGTSVAEFRATTLEEIGKRGSPPMTANAMPSASRMPRMKFGGDFHEFSLQRAVQAAITSDYSRAGYEREVQQELAQRAGRSAEGFFVPSSALSKRTLLTTSNTTNLVGVDHLGSAFIDSLENETVVLSAGATVLSDLSKDVSIPKMTAGTAAEWIAEGAAPSESTPTFGAVSLQPHQLAARASYTRKMLLQSDPNLEELLRSDLRRQTGIALDAAAITGTGSSGQPTGVLNTSGIGSVAIGTNGGAITWAKVVELETAVSIDNALMGRLGYVTNSAVTGAMKTIEKASNTAEYILGENAEKLAGHRFWMSNNVPSDLDKGSSTGVCSALIFGNWADLLVGEFGMMDLIVDPYTNADKGDVRIVVHSFWDIGVRHAESFAACLDITTS